MSLTFIKGVFELCRAHHWLHGVN